MKLRALWIAGVIASFAWPAIGAPGEVKRRRAERHSSERSEALKQTRVHRIDTVVVSGRPQRPMASVELSVERVRFPVGTARYNERDQRFLKKTSANRW